nr:receptor-like protein EIX2 [Ziziphus jujuba var. spinosa]
MDLGSNQFDGPLTLFSSNISTLSLNNNMLSGSIPSDIGKAMPMLTYLDISWNSLNGGIPLSIGNLTQLEFFIISDNHLSGQVPDVWKDVMGLRALDVSNNMLSGTIPKSISFLQMLTFLLLSNNNFSGEFPSCLHSCSSLVSLDLGDNKFSGKLRPLIGENMVGLMNLRLTSNFFSGNIPPEFCDLSSLHILDLSRNNLSGHISHCLGNFGEMRSDDIYFVGSFTLALTNGSFKTMAKGRELEYKYPKLYLLNSIDLSDNNLSGEIPVQLTSLIGLQTLNLSANRLTGKIPANIGNLTTLETLDLSRNKLFGPIPVSMISLTFLNHLNLSYNNLTGKIPTANQFLTFDDLSIYQGNAGLSGKPLDNVCLGSNQFGTPRGEKEEKDGDVGDKTEKVGLHISIALGFIVGFWSVFGSLIINRCVISVRILLNRIKARKSPDFRVDSGAANKPHKIGGFEFIKESFERLIPADIGNSKSLETPDLSRNILFGPVPLSMPPLTFLNHLNLSYDNLSGKIPTSNQFQTLKTHQSIKAMLASWKLLKTDCIVDAPPGEKAEEDDDVGDPIIEQLGFVISMILGFFVGLWGVWRTLIIRRSWRDA